MVTESNPCQQRLQVQGALNKTTQPRSKAARVSELHLTANDTVTDGLRPGYICERASLCGTALEREERQRLNPGLWVLLFLVFVSTD
ncbi:hypothetical protein GJAV_G00144720 [Gymnothorax javanicus]|nr:hypothetical protein GJAV_G00144720 [Gymnothorax javanicus]